VAGEKAYSGREKNNHTHAAAGAFYFVVHLLGG